MSRHKPTEAFRKFCREHRCKIIMGTSTRDPGYDVEAPKNFHFKATWLHCFYSVYPDQEEEIMEQIRAGVVRCEEDTPCEDMQGGVRCYWKVD